MVSRTYNPQMGMNHAYLNKVLFRGNYTLKIRDPFPTNSRSSSLACQPYSISYLLNATTITDTTCNDVDLLPTDLYSDGK